MNPRSLLTLMAVFLAIPASSRGDDAKSSSTHTVQSGRFQVIVSLDGVFESEQMFEIILQPKQWSSLIVEEAVPLGMQARAGDTLIQLDSQKIDDEIRSTEFLVESGRLSLEQIQAEFEALEKSVPLDLKAAEDALQQAQRDWEYHKKYWEALNRENAEETLKYAEYNLESAQEELKQLEQMYKEDDLTEETEEYILKRARRRVESAELSLRSAKARYEEKIQDTLPRQDEKVREAVVRQEIALARAKVDLPLSLEKKRIELEKARFAQQELEEKLEKLLADRELMTVRSPADGVVFYGKSERGKWTSTATIAKQMRKGGSLSANQVLLTIVPSHKLFIRVNIPEKHLRAVHSGLAALVTPAVDPAVRLNATIQTVDPVPYKDNLYNGTLQLLDESQDYHSGMNAKVRVVTYRSEQALTIPSSAIQTDEWDDTQKYVFLKTNEGTERRDVELGQSNGKVTEVLKGLKAGDVILLKKPE